MTDLNFLLSQMTDFLKSEAKTETIIGQQFQLGEFTCVPVISIGLGFGGGGGEGKGTTKGTAEGEGVGAGAGAGIGMGPVGFLVTKGGEIQFVPTKNTKGLSSLFEKIPEVLEKFIEKNKQTEKSGTVCN
jgi:uncharacterized spore protein YtfJ